MIEKFMTMVERFNREVIRLPIPDEPTRLSEERKRYAIDHLNEEVNEFEDATDLADEVDALVDLVYVALGRLVEMGVAPEPVFMEVHLANMRKERGEVAKRPSSLGHDAVKPDDWVAPDLVPYLDVTRGDLMVLRDWKNLIGSMPLPSSLDGGPQFEDVDKKTLADETGFTKDDDGKLCRPELVPAPIIHALGVLYAKGAVKYSDENWREATDPQRWIGAAERHLLAWRMGETHDDGPGGSGCHHLVAAMWNLGTLFMLDERGQLDPMPDQSTMYMRDGR